MIVLISDGESYDLTGAAQSSAKISQGQDHSLYIQWPRASAGGANTVANLTGGNLTPRRPEALHDVFKRIDR